MNEFIRKLLDMEARMKVTQQGMIMIQQKMRDVRLLIPLYKPNAPSTRTLH